jgi:hypothetical protein
MSSRPYLRPEAKARCERTEGLDHIGSPDGIRTRATALRVTDQRDTASSSSARPLFDSLQAGNPVFRDHS